MLYILFFDLECGGKSCAVSLCSATILFTHEEQEQLKSFFLGGGGGGGYPNIEIGWNTEIFILNQRI